MVVVLGIFVAGLFVVGYDQGHIFSLVYGEQAFEDLYIHELTHDMRHDWISLPLDFDLKTVFLSLLFWFQVLTQFMEL